MFRRRMGWCLDSMGPSPLLKNRCGGVYSVIGTCAKSPVPVPAACISGRHYSPKERRHEITSRQACPAASSPSSRGMRISSVASGWRRRTASTAWTWPCQRFLEARLVRSEPLAIVVPFQTVEKLQRFLGEVCRHTPMLAVHEPGSYCAASS